MSQKCHEETHAPQQIHTPIPPCCLGPRGNQHAESAVMHDAFDHCGKRLIDGVKALSNKVGGRRVSRPNEIAVPEVRYVSDVVTRWRRHPPEIGITILLPNMNLFHQS